MPETDDLFKVLPCPDLSDHRFIGGVRVYLPHGGVLDLSAERAAKLAEAIIAALYQGGRLRRTI